MLRQHRRPARRQVRRPLYINDGIDATPESTGSCSLFQLVAGLAIAGIIGAVIWMAVDLGANSTKTTEIQANVTAFEMAVDQELEDLADEISAIANNASMSLPALEQMVMALGTNVSSLATDLEQVGGQVGGLTSNVTQVEADVEQLEGQVTELVTNGTQLAGDVDQLEDQVAELATNATQLESDVDQLEQATLYTAGTELMAYVSSGGSPSGSCEIGDQCTLDRAIQVLGMHKVTRCIIQVVGTIDLGDAPHTCFFPVMERCKHVIVRGNRADVAPTTGTQSGTFGPNDAWTRLNLAGTLTSGLYDKSFVWNEALQKHFVVASNTPTFASIVADNSDWSNSDPLTFFTLTSSIQFTGRWTLDIPFGFVRFETIHLDPQSNTGQLAALSTVTNRIAFHGCRMGSGSSDSYQGPFVAQGCHAPGVFGGAYVFQPSSQQSLSIESLYVEDASLLFRGPTKAQDLLLDNSQLNANTGDARFLNVLIQTPPGGTPFNIFESVNAGMKNIDVSGGTAGIGMFGSCKCEMRDVSVSSTGISILASSGSTVTVRGELSVSSPQPIVINSGSFLDLQAGSTISRTTGVADGILIDSGSNAFIFAVTSRPIVFTQASGQCIRVERGSSAFIDASPASAFGVATNGFFLAMTRQARVFGGGFVPINTGTGGVLFLCDAGASSWVNQDTTPGCSFARA